MIAHEKPTEAVNSGSKSQPNGVATQPMESAVADNSMFDTRFLLPGSASRRRQHRDQQTPEHGVTAWTMPLWTAWQCSRRGVRVAAVQNACATPETGSGERLHESLCEFGRVGHGPDVTAGEFDDDAAKLLAQHHAHLMAGVTTRLPADGQDHPIGIQGENIEVELDRRVLA